MNRDLWLNWSQKSCINFICQTLTASMLDLERYLGVRWPISVLYVHPEKDVGPVVEWLMRWDQMYALGHEMLDLLASRGYRRRLLERDWPEACQRLAGLIDERVARSGELGDAELKQLAEGYERFAAEYRQWYAMGWFAEPVLFTAQRLLGADIGGIRKASELGRVSGELGIDPGTLRARIAFSERPSVAAALQASLSSIAKQLEETAGADELPTGNRAALQKWLERAAESAPELHASVVEHSRKYYWADNDYSMTTVIEPTDVLERAAGLRGHEGVNTGDLSSGKRQALAHFAPYYRDLIGLIDEMGALHDTRKMYIQRANHVLDAYLREIARRTERRIEDVRNLLGEELPEFVQAPGELDETLERRRDGAVILWSRLPIGARATQGTGMDGGVAASEPFRPAGWVTDSPDIVDGRGACEELINDLEDRLHFMADAPDRDLDVLQGECVFALDGKDVVEADARVVLDPRNAASFGEGDVLVARSTTPDFVPLMHKASCIVTDWGGWTSHAALCARDFGIPCVVDTSYATQVLTDGERVRIHVREGRIERNLA